MKQIFEQVFIKSDSDLPKKDGDYYCYMNAGGIGTRHYEFSTKQWWMSEIDWYLLPIEQPAEKEYCKCLSHRNLVYAMNSDKPHCSNCHKDIQTQPEKPSSPAMSPKPQEEITDEMPISVIEKEIIKQDNEALFSKGDYAIGFISGVRFREKQHITPTVIKNIVNITDEMIEKQLLKMIHGNGREIFAFMKWYRSQMTANRRDELIKFAQQFYADEETCISNVDYYLKQKV